MAKFADTQLLTEKVMGTKRYHPNPVCAVCPFVGDGCPDDESCRRLNGICSISQLYSHWQKYHVGNKAAGQLETRWRLALKNPRKPKQWLDERAPLELTPEWMEQQGGLEQGYEQLRPPLAPDADAMFSTFNFELHSVEHRSWLEAEGTPCFRPPRFRWRRDCVHADRCGCECALRGGRSSVARSSAI